jgi:NAD(P)H dehydrogenase (quinone)
VIKLAIIFHSVTGTTKQLASSVAADIIEGRFNNCGLLEKLTDVDAIIFGSPTFMGSMSAQFKAFADATGELWAEKAWSDKVAAGFTIGSNLSGDQLHTIQYLQVFANQHGMLWASLDIPGNCDPQNRNRLGAQSGLIAHSKDGQLNDTDLMTAHYLGQRVAHVTKKFAM